MRFRYLRSLSCESVTEDSVTAVCFVAYLMYVHINLILKTVEHYEHTFFADFAAFADKPQAALMFLEDTVFIVFGSEVKAFRN